MNPVPKLRSKWPTADLVAVASILTQLSRASMSGGRLPVAPGRGSTRQRVLHSYACALRYPEGRHARTNRGYGDAVVTLLTRISRHPELRAAVSTLMPNLQRAARIVAIHQERGDIGSGDPFQKVVFLIAPMLAEGLWRRGGAETGAPAFDPEAVADAFLQGHRAAPIDDPGP